MTAKSKFFAEVLLAMPTYQINPSPRLSGEAAISTSKNAVLPILAAALLTEEEVMIRRVPSLTDTAHMLEILRACGAEAALAEGHACIHASALHSPGESAPLQSMRASVLVLGPLAARNGECQLSMPGGCAIGQRPIDLHLKGLQKLGAKVEMDGGVVRLSGQLRGANIYLDFPVAILVTGIAVIPTILCRRFKRWQGIVLLGIYLAYLVTVTVGLGWYLSLFGISAG